MVLVFKLFCIILPCLYVVIETLGVQFNNYTLLLLYKATQVVSGGYYGNVSSIPREIFLYKPTHTLC